MEVTAGVVTLAGEGLVLAICQMVPVKFENMKIAFDVTLVLTACALSFLFLGGLHGVREGTVAAALCVGLVAKEMKLLFAGLPVNSNQMNRLPGRLRKK